MIARQIWLSMRVQFIPALVDNLSARFPIRKLLEVGLLSPSSWPDNKVERALFGDRELIRISQLCPRAQLLGVRTPPPQLLLGPLQHLDKFFLGWVRVQYLSCIFTYFAMLLQLSEVTRLRRILCCRRDNCNTTALRTKFRTSFFGFIMFSQRFRQYNATKSTHFSVISLKMF